MSRRATFREEWRIPNWWGRLDAVYHRAPWLFLGFGRRLICKRFEADMRASWYRASNDGSGASDG